MKGWYFTNKLESPPTEIVYIRWKDVETHGDAGWQDPTRLEEFALSPPVVFHTVGFLVYDARPDYVVVAESLGEDDCSAMTKIPCGIIEEIKWLGPIQDKESGGDNEC